MADGTKIEWTDATWNPITGCSVVSPGCTNCYAMKLAGTRLKHTPSRQGLTTDSKAGLVWNGEVRFNEQWLDQPLRWTAPRRIFVCAHGDLFHENVPDEWIDHVFAVMACSPQHTFQVLTKRPGRMLEYLSDGNTWDRIEDISEDRTDFNSDNPFYSRGLPLPNVWLGVSVEDQTRADERIPLLLQTTAAKRFLSIEPLLGPVDLAGWLPGDNGCEGRDDGEGYGNRCSRTDIPRSERCPWTRAVQTVVEHGPFDADGMPARVTCDVQTVNWVIVGGESGPSARPMHPDWARSLRDQCATAGVPFFFKQWGEYQPRTHGAVDGWAVHWQPGHDRWVDGLSDRENTMIRVGKKRAGAMLDGKLWREMPA